MFKILVAAIATVNANMFEVEDVQALNINQGCNRADEDFQNMLNAFEFKDHGYGYCGTDNDGMNKYINRHVQWKVRYFSNAADAFRTCAIDSKKAVGSKLLAVDFEFQSGIKLNHYECFAITAKHNMPASAHIVGT